MATAGWRGLRDRVAAGVYITFMFTSLITRKQWRGLAKVWGFCITFCISSFSQNPLPLINGQPWSPVGFFIYYTSSQWRLSSLGLLNQHFSYSWRCFFLVIIHTLTPVSSSFSFLGFPSDIWTISPPTSEGPHWESHSTYCDHPKWTHLASFNKHTWIMPCL